MEKQKIYTLKEFAEVAGVCTKTLSNWEKQGILVSYKKVSGRKYYTDEHLKIVYGGRNAR